MHLTFLTLSLVTCDIHQRLFMKIYSGTGLSISILWLVSLLASSQLAAQSISQLTLADALDAALRKSLIKFYPGIKDMHLFDYKVRVVNAKEGTAARVRVIIESRDKTATWGTVGVSENIIQASWLALVDSVEYKLHKDAKG